MKIIKNILAKLDGVYAVCNIELFGRLHFLAATEKQGKCFLFSTPNWKVSVVWQEPGGTMDLKPIGSGKGAFLAIQNFFPVFKAKEARIVYFELENNKDFQWKLRELICLPFVHRIGVVYIDNNPYLIASTFCGDKKDNDDSFTPGAVYIGKMPEKNNEILHLEPIIKNISMNHGFHINVLDNRKIILVSGNEGIFLIFAPENSNLQWEYKCLIDKAVSDIFLFDLDNDGVKEIITIEPFHGDNLLIYKFFKDKFEPIYNMDINSGHALWCGQLNNLQFILLGNRSGKKELFFIKVINSDSNRKFNHLKLEKIILDEGGGPSQISVTQKAHDISILTANNYSGEVVLYNIVGFEKEF
ncbi:MAG: hypothetical protein FJW56_03515 [Actinobacteria bacterium]|nr:hypothetical protein [Actinomycetota bacterium]